jgi:hypothetical protein
MEAEELFSAESSYYADAMEAPLLGVDGEETPTRAEDIDEIEEFLSSNFKFGLHDENRSMKRGLRGSPARALHDGRHDNEDWAQPWELGAGSASSNVFEPSYYNSTAPAMQQTPAENETPGGEEKGAENLLLTILCLMILSPCLLASVAQTIYCVKKRKADRVERQLQEVSENPTSRMLVLSEIFKNDSRPVTEDEASPKKKRVRVKKHRKKTRSELRAERKERAKLEADGQDEEMGRQLGASNEWSDDEEDDDIILARTASSDTERPMIVYVSSFEHLSGDVEQGFARASEHNMEDDVSDIEDNIGKAGTNELALEECHRLAFAEEEQKEGEEQVGTHCLQERFQDDAEGASPGVASVTAKMSDQYNASDLDREGRGEVDNDNTSADMDQDGKDFVSKQDSNNVEEAHVSPGSDVDNEVICKEDLKDNLGLADSLSVGKQGDKDTAPTSISVGDSPKLELEGNPGANSKTDGSLAADRPQAVPLVPNIPSVPLLRDSEDESQDKASSSSPTDVALSLNAPDIPPLNIDAPPLPKRYLSPRSSRDELDKGQSSAPTFPCFGDAGSKGEGCAYRGSIFRANDERESTLDEDAQSIPGIQGCGSSVTEVTSNIDELKQVGSSYDEIKLEPRRSASFQDKAVSSLFAPYQLEHPDSYVSHLSSGLGAPVPLKKVDSLASAGASSNVSYFSYEDMSIASEESEMCAICLCPYEEGDVRIFSKRCTHVFHKDCILLWLVKSHNECPCCRIDMVTKSEIKETSASLLGTERLAQALAVVSGSEMQEAPPFRRTGRARLGRQMLARARAQRRRTSSGQANERGGSSLVPPPSPNSHWLWTARFDLDGQSGPNTGSSPSLSSMPTLGEHVSSPRANNSTNNTTSSHNRDWLWATRFGSSSTSSNSSQQPAQQPRVINPSRSSDAIMNPHETNQNNLAVAQEVTSVHEPSIYNTAAGSLFSSSMYHDHWHRRTIDQRRNNQNSSITLSPRRYHSNWRQTAPNSNVGADITLSPARLHSNWRQTASNSTVDADLTRSPGRLHSNWRQNLSNSNVDAVLTPSPSRRHNHWRQHEANSNTDAGLPVTVLPPI